MTLLQAVIHYETLTQEDAPVDYHQFSTKPHDGALYRTYYRPEQPDRLTGTVT
jgi:hypothetical protein